MNIIEKYNQEISTNRIQPDPVQQQAVELLQQAKERLENLPPRQATLPTKPKNKGFFSFFASPKDEPEIVIQEGLYFWGGVWRGKTWLMDLFFESVAIEDKQRYHFHHFMEKLHKAISNHPDQEDPLEMIAKLFAQEFRLLCLDELHLTEITNARLLLPVLEHLIRNGVMLVSTSNRHPDELYQGNLKRELFIPYTDFLQQHMKVLHLDNGQDYRTLGVPENISQAALQPLTEEALEACFDKLAKGKVERDVVFTINHRQVPIKRACDNIIWLDFSVACEGTRTTSDYIWMTDRYEVIMLSGVHVLTEDHEPAARRFFNMVDELYDRRIRFLFSAQATLDKLYQGRRLTFAFKRTLSRLTAMHVGNGLNCDD